MHVDLHGIFIVTIAVFSWLEVLGAKIYVLKNTQLHVYVQEMDTYSRAWMISIHYVHAGAHNYKKPVTSIDGPYGAIPYLVIHPC